MKTPALAVLLLVPLAGVHGETYDIAVFEPPAGWERVSAQGPLSFRTPQGRGSPAQIFLFPSRASDKSPADNFQADWATLVTGALGASGAAQAKTEQLPGNWTAVSGGANVNRQGATLSVVLLTVSGHGRTMSIVASLTGQDRLAEIGQFFSRLSFRPGTEAPAPSAAAPSGGSPAVAGLYYRVRTGIGSGARLEADTRFFLPGNRITRTFPFGGGDRFDPARCNPDMCGTYAIEGSTITIRWDNGRVDRLPFASAGAGGISIDGDQFKPALPVADGALVGGWRGAGSVGGSFANQYTFQSDGTFRFGSGSSGLGGRYRVQGLTLILQFNDGDERRRTLFAVSAGDAPAMVAVDGEVYQRQR